MSKGVLDDGGLDARNVHGAMRRRHPQVSQPTDMSRVACMAQQSANESYRMGDLTGVVM